ncbi:MAG: hypothetical protein U0V72_13190 [Cytophagales bacterium]
MNKLLLVSFSFIFLFSCKKKEKNVAQVCNSKDTVSFHADIKPLLTLNCALSGCHMGNSPSGGLNLESDKAYIELTNIKSGYIDTLAPKRSLLYSSLVSTDNPMPPKPFSKLNDCDIQLIVQWMQEGGKNN